MKAHRLAAHTFFNFVNILVSSILGILISALVARSLAPSLMGSYTLIVYLSSLCGLVINLGFVTTAMRFMAEALGKKDEGANQEAAAVLAESIRVVLLNGLLIFIIWSFLAPWIGRFYHDPSLILPLWIAGLALIPTALIALLTAACQGMQRYDQVALNTALCAPVTLFGSILVLRAGWGIIGLVSVNSLVYCFGLSLYLYFFHRWRAGWFFVKASKEIKQRMWHYSLPLFGMLLLDAVVWQRSGVFFLGAFSPAREIAFYGLAFGLATMAMRLVPGTLIGLLIPSMSRSHGAGDIEGMGRIFRKSCQWMAILAMPVGFAGSILAPKVIELLYGKAYLIASNSLVVLLVSGAIVMTYGFPSSSVLYSADGERSMLWIGVRVAVANVLLALCFIPPLGALGAALANSLSQLLSIPLGLKAVQKRIGENAPRLILLKTALASAFMSLPIAVFSVEMPPLAAILFSLLIGPPLYFLALCFLKGLDAEDQAMGLELIKGFSMKKRDSLRS